MAKRETVTDGPDRLELAASLFGGSKVFFTMESGRTRRAVITSVMHADERTHFPGIEGRFTRYEIQGYLGYGDDCQKFSGYYSTSSREGYLDVEDPIPPILSGEGE